MLYAKFKKDGKVYREFFRTFSDLHRATFSPDIEVEYVKKHASNKSLQEFGFCTAHGGKMSGILSISTSPTLNTRCAARAKNPESVCHECYSCAMMKYRKTLNRKLMRNTVKLTSGLIDEKDIPFINPILWPLVRFESFGDLINETQVKNFFAIADCNPQCNFALWTKTPDIVASAIGSGAVKPANLIIVISSDQLNVETSIDRWPFADKVFTVYDNDHEINCGARSCATCRKCYYNNGIVHLYEKLK